MSIGCMAWAAFWIPERVCVKIGLGGITWQRVKSIPIWVLSGHLDLENTFLSIHTYSVSIITVSVPAHLSIPIEGMEMTFSYPASKEQHARPWPRALANQFASKLSGCGVLILIIHTPYGVHT